MDILNFISWIKGGRRVTTLSKKTVLPIAVKDAKRDDQFITGYMTTSDFASQLGVPTLDEEGNLVIANSASDTVAVDNGASHLIPNFSGMLLVNDHYDGGVELWIAGGGDTGKNFTILCFVSCFNYCECKWSC